MIKIEKDLAASKDSCVQFCSEVNNIWELKMGRWLFWCLERKFGNNISMECISECLFYLNIDTTNKSKSNGVNEEEEPLNTRSHKDPVSHDATASLAMGVQI